MAKRVKEENKNNKGVSNERLCAILSYLLVGVIWYFIDKNLMKSKFVKFHVKQGIVFLIADVLYGIVLNIIASIVFSITGVSGATFGLMGSFQLLTLIPVVFLVIGIINAANGNERELPIIGKFARKLEF